MNLIPAILPITKLKVYSIDRKGRATLEIKLLSFPKTKKAFTITKCHSKYHEDQVILVNKECDTKKHIHTLDRVVGPVSSPSVWNTILPYRISVAPSLKRHEMYTPLTIQCSLSEQNHYTSLGTPSKFLCIDSPGTVDREDGFWYSSPYSMGVFVIDLPSQFKWTHNMKVTTQYLCDMLHNQSNITHTRTLYLPTHRLPLMDPSCYTCVNQINHSLPILCYDIISSTLFSSTIESYHDVSLHTYLDSPSTYPTWFMESKMNTISVSEQNEILNSKWYKQKNLQFNTISVLFKKKHPTYSSYYPISSPVRSLGDLWNQCVYWDTVQERRWKSSFNHVSQSLFQRIIRDTLKSKYLSLHSNSLSLVTHILTEEIDTMKANITYIHMDNKQSIQFGFATVLQTYTVFLPKEIFSNENITLHDTITVQFTLTKHPDPFRMIQVRLPDSEQETTTSATDTKTES